MICELEIAIVFYTKEFFYEKAYSCGICNNLHDISGGLRRQGKGIDIYMQKKDGSLELLLEKVPELYGQYKLLLGEDIYLYDATSIIKLDRQGREMYSTIASAAIGGLVRTVCLLPDNGLMAGAYNKDTRKMELWRMDGDTGKFEEKPFVVNQDGQSYLSCGKEGAHLLSQLGVWAVDEGDGRLKGEFLFEGTSYSLTFSGKDNPRIFRDFQVTDENTLKLLWEDYPDGDNAGNRKGSGFILLHRNAGRHVGIDGKGCL